MSSKSARFFRVVLTHNLESGTLELPADFMNEQGKYLSKDICLIVPTGAKSKMELKRYEDKALLNKGWLEFAKKYSIENRSILVFEYEGSSCFSVKIFDMSSAEIIYPPVTSHSTRKKNVVNEEDSDESSQITITDDSSDEYPQEVQKTDKGREYANQYRKLIAEQSDLRLKAMKERVLERAMAFESPNPHFMIPMTKTYANGRCYLYIKRHIVEAHFPKVGQNRMLLKLNGADNRTWPMEYSKQNRGGYTCKNWYIFVRDNSIEAEDICVFELVRKKEMVFNVTIFRINDDADEVETIARAGSNPTPSKRKVKSAMKRVMNRADSFKSENPHFRICITSACIGGVNVEIPRAHSRRYLKEDGDGEKYVVFHGSSGRTWPVDYYHSSSNQSSVSEAVLLTNGWIEFVEENHLQEGDCCIFEMINGESKAYKVTIYSVGDHA